MRIIDDIMSDVEAMNPEGGTLLHITRRSLREILTERLVTDGRLNERMAERSSMTPADLHDARKRLGMTQRGLAEALRLTGDDPARTVRSWEKGERPITGPVQVAVGYMLREREQEETPMTTTNATSDKHLQILREMLDDDTWYAPSDEEKAAIRWALREREQCQGADRRDAEAAGPD